MIPQYPFSAVIITKNEVENIEPCLKALTKITNDIVVIDGDSTDGTVALCEQYGARVFKNEWLGYAATKNLGNTKAHNDWILSIDADEVLSEELIRSIQTLMPLENNVYALDRISSLYGKWIHYSGWYPDWKPRFFNRNQVQWQGDYVHETLNIPKNIKVKKLKGKLWHYTYKNEEDHKNRLERYAQLAAAEMYAKGKKPTFIKRIFSPLARFFKHFILQKGFLDGKSGWIIAKENARMVSKKYALLKEKRQRS